MAIIKIDRQAVSQCRILAEHDGKTFREPQNHLKFAATEPFSLLVKPPQGDGINYDVILKIFLNGCSDREEGKYVSVFLEISRNDGQTMENPLMATLFLRNMKDDKGNSFRRCIKIDASGDKVERGMKNFVSVQDFDILLVKDYVISFGLLITQCSEIVKEVSLSCKF